MGLRIAMTTLVLLACGDSAPDRPDRWHVSDGQLRDADGRSVVLRGANVSSAHKSAPYFDFHELADFRIMRDEWGLNSVRFLIEWAAVEPERGTFDDAYLDAVAQRIEWAHTAGLVVIMDMHQDVYGEGFGVGNGAPGWTCDQSHYDAFEPTTPWFANYGNEHVIACYDNLWSSPDVLTEYVEAWRRVAVRLADSPAVIGFDVMNEPYWGSLSPSTFEQDVLGPLYADVVAAVRDVAPGWVAFLEPSASRNLGFATSLEAFAFDDVVYSPHSYDQMAEAGEGFDAARRDAVIGNYDLFRQEAEWLGAALWIGEYGGVAADGGISAYMDAQFDGAAGVGAGTSYWHYSKDGGYGILEADGSEKPELMVALVRPYPERVAGSLDGFDYDETSRVLTVRSTPDATVSATTDIIVPTRVYPNGVAIECGGCEVHVDDGVARLTDGPELITISPVQ
jgi:endoglycosylceramidase